MNKYVHPSIARLQRANRSHAAQPATHTAAQHQLGAPGTAAHTLGLLQRTHGNHAVARMLAHAPLARTAALPAIQRRGGAATGTQLILESGSSGPAVEEAQTRLNLHGASLKVDGIFGPKTRAAVRAFQLNHQDNEGNTLAIDGQIGPKTRWALGQAPGAGPAPAPDPSKKLPADELRDLFAKGDAITADEALRAKELLFSLDGDAFRKALKEAIANGDFMRMLLRLPLGEIFATLSNLSQEVVIPTTLLRPAPDTIADDFKRANEIYGPHGIEIEQGSHLEIDEATSKLLIGDDLSLNDRDPADANTLLKEAKALIEENRNRGRISGYWLPATDRSIRGTTFTDSLKNSGPDRISVIVNAPDRAQDTFAHELGHALNLDHEDSDANNLMASGGVRNISGAGIDKLTDAQLAIIRNSVFAELGKKGVGS
ncbi:MAG TPA: peptidoglycan-binding protein [Roseiflexaceae bacterium]|nr:peptidoglycan-binding protein [Roseiflexaceae bacterium]